jgi:hypothetical protein
MQNKIPKKMWVIWAVCIPLGITAGFFSTKLLKTPPQKGAARSFLIEHAEIFSQLGNVKSITYAPDASTRVLFGVNGAEGVYNFKAICEKGTGNVRVYWKSKGDNFTVVRIELIQGSNVPIILWENYQTN